MTLAGWLDTMSKKLSRWSPVQEGQYVYLYKPVRVSSLEALKHLGESITPEGGRTEYRADNIPRSWEDLVTVPEAQLDSITIHSYNAPSPAVGPSGLEDYAMRVAIFNPDRRRQQGPQACGIVAVGPAPFTNHRLRIEVVQSVVDRCTMPVGAWERRKPYTVLNQTTQADVRRQNHERKIRWQSWIGGAGFGALGGFLTVVGKSWLHL